MVSERQISLVCVITENKKKIIKKLNNTPEDNKQRARHSGLLVNRCITTLISLIINFKKSNEHNPVSMTKRKIIEILIINNL